MFSFMVTLLLKVEILTIRGEDLRKISLDMNLTKWLSKCESSLHIDKDDWEDLKCLIYYYAIIF